MGLFRITGTSTIVKKLRKLYNQSGLTGEYPVLADIEEFRPPDAAGLLKMFFHDLPDPLLPYSYFDIFRKIQSKYCKPLLFGFGGILDKC